MSEASKLTVKLVDICVHLGPPNVPVAHRAVYPAGTSSLLPGVLLHAPTLEVPGQAAVPLNGATVTFSDGAPGATFTGFPLPPCVPHLKQWFPWIELSRKAVDGHDIGADGNRGAYIDFSFGRIAMASSGTSVSTDVVMEYPEGTTSVKIAITPWPPSTIEVASIDVPLPATVTVSSIASSDSINDYALTFQVAAGTPPASPRLRQELEALIGFLQHDCKFESEDSVGCSNSQFP